MNTRSGYRKDSPHIADIVDAKGLRDHSFNLKPKCNMSLLLEKVGWQMHGVSYAG